MAKYGRFDPRNKKRKNDKYRGERKKQTKQPEYDRSEINYDRYHQKTARPL